MDAVSFIHGLRYGDMPDEVLHQARGLLLDLIGVAAAGIETDLSRILRGQAADQFGAGAGAASARMMLDGRYVSPTGAAMAGAGTIDSIDAHDGHKLTKGHMGVTVLPALLAFCDAAKSPVSAYEFLTSFVLGYELGTRAGVALHNTVPDYHTSGAWNALAAAGIGARLLGLSPDATRHALGIAEYHGPRSQMMRCIAHPTMLKDGSAWGALGGVSAAYLARDGFTGAPAISIEDAPDYWADLGTRWTILEQYIKPYPVCRWAQPAVHGALALRDMDGFDAAKIGSVEVQSFAEAVALTARRPETTEQAQYSLPFPVAAALVHGDIAPGRILGTALQDADVCAIAERMVLREDPALSRRFPAERLARITVRYEGGLTLDSGLLAALGDPEEPLSDADLEAKFRLYLEGTPAAPLVDTLLEAIWTLGSDNASVDAPATPLLEMLLATPGPAAARSAAAE